MGIHMTEYWLCIDKIRYKSFKNNAKQSHSRHFRNELIFISISFLSVGRVHANLFIIFLESSHILPGFRELSFLHTLPYVPVHECPLSVHQIKLVVQSSPGLSYGSRVGQHTDGSLNLGQITPRDDSRGLVVDPNLEASGTPIHKLHTSLGLDGSDGGIDVLGHHIASVEHAAGHVLPMARVALDHGTGWLETGVGDLGNVQLLVISLLSRDDRGVGNEREMDPGVGNEIRLELVQIDVQSSVKPQGGSD